VLQAALEDSHKVLVIGAGIVGLSVIQMIRALGSKSMVYAVARYDFQKELASKSGADRVLNDSDDLNVTAQLADELKARYYYSRFVKPFLMGGFDVIFDCVGTAETIHKGIRWANQGGKVVLIGASPAKRFEWSLLYWKEIKLLGSLSYGMETVNGIRMHAFDAAFQMIEQNRLKLDIFPIHKYRLDEYQEAFAGLVHKGKSQPVKTAFVFT
jgi:threonine dehydrogenase-like Zn-dependent dehydrogenase